MKIKYLSVKEGTPASGYWDQALIGDVLNDPIFEAMDSNGAIVILPGAYQGDYIKQINQELAKLEWVILIVTSDEEGKFPIEKIRHPNIKIYLTYPKRNRHEKYGKIPLGYTSETRKNLVLYDKKDLNFFFSGQNTHDRRKQCIEQLKEMKGGLVNATEGFSQGMDASTYMSNMARAKVAPSPAGPVSADSFRTYEALEAGAIPIADNISLAGDKNYWRFLFEDPPFPTINDYSDLPGYTKDQYENFQSKANKIQAWWIKYKRDLRNRFIDDVAELTGKKYVKQITVIIPTSVIPSNPSTKIIDETIKSVRHHLPDAEIILTFDGLRQEQEDRREAYEEYIRRALFKANTEWGNVVPIIFNKQTHQVGMARVALQEINTPLILYMEQDAPIVTDLPIEWDKLSNDILSGVSNMIRFHFEAFVPKEHIHMMIGEPENGLLKTAQWSQRPHLASTAFYRRILSENFSDKSNCFIEDLIHGKLHEAYLKDGVQGWQQWRVHIYHPEGNIKRSYHTDGREGSEKYDKNQIW